jgi:hypothetical protein
LFGNRTSLSSTAPSFLARNFLLIEPLPAELLSVS